MTSFLEELLAAGDWITPSLAWIDSIFKGYVDFVVQARDRVGQIRAALDNEMPFWHCLCGEAPSIRDGLCPDCGRPRSVASGAEKIKTANWSVPAFDWNFCFSAPGDHVPAICRVLDKQKVAYWWN